jgi:hypothetical protein
VRRSKDFSSSRSDRSRVSEHISESSRGNHFNDRDHAAVLFHSTRERIGNASDDKGNVYQTGALTGAIIAAPAQSDDGNLWLTLTVGDAA